MNCPTDTTLRAYLDAELSPEASSELQQHLQSCSACQVRFRELSATASRVASQLALLDAPPSALEANPHIALARFNANLPHAEEDAAPLPFFARLFSPRSRFAWAASLAGAALVISLMFPATRSFAQRLLATLRVERIQTVTLDLGPLDNGSSHHQPLEALSKLLSDNAVVTTNQKPIPASSQDAATQAAGFPVRVLAARTDTPSFEISGAHAFHLTLNRSRLQDILDQAGRPDLLLPATLDGAPVSVQIPRAVALKYGNCGKQNPQSPGQAAASTDPCLLLIEAPSPTINVPSDLNIQQLAEIGLQFVGWSPVKAREFCQTVDWKSTLVLPIPDGVDSYETVNLNGVHATLMHFPNSNNNQRPSFALIWVNDGIIYSLIGHGDSTSAVQLASSLQ
jgi:hypothetical protein